jgi:hypothetical protein
LDIWIDFDKSDLSDSGGVGIAGTAQLSCGFNLGQNCRQVAALRRQRGARRKSVLSVEAAPGDADGGTPERTAEADRSGDAGYGEAKWDDRSHHRELIRPAGSPAALV